VAGAPVKATPQGRIAATCDSPVASGSPDSIRDPDGSGRKCRPPGPGGVRRGGARRASPGRQGQRQGVASFAGGAANERRSGGEWLIRRV